jgi:hypothetical protein
MRAGRYRFAAEGEPQHQARAGSRRAEWREEGIAEKRRRSPFDSVAFSAPVVARRIRQ